MKAVAVLNCLYLTETINEVKRDKHVLLKYTPKIWYNIRFHPDSNNVSWFLCDADDRNQKLAPCSHHSFQHSFNEKSSLPWNISSLCISSTHNGTYFETVTIYVLPVQTRISKSRWISIFFIGSSSVLVVYWNNKESLSYLWSWIIQDHKTISRWLHQKPFH